MIEVIIDTIRVSLISQHRIVMLRDSDGERQLPIWIGPPEADAIAIELQKTEKARPMTHDLLRNVIEELGGNISYMIVNELKDNTFYARLVLDVGGETREIDCRPSDALALSVRVDAPMFVAESVMQEAGILPEDDISEMAEIEEVVDEGELPPPAEKAAEAESADDLDAFMNFVDTLDFDDEDNA